MNYASATWCMLMTGCAGLVLATPALAQSERPTVTDEIIVTAQRRSEVIEDVPMAVQVVTSEALENAGIRNFMDLGSIAVGAQMGFNGSVPTAAVRGITSALSAYNAEPNVAVYVDGLYDSQPLTIAADLSNIDSIQILKGPQGTLYGRNATGGAILVNTLGPSDVFTGKFDISYERFDRVTLNGYLAGPLSDRARLSVSGHYRHGDLSLRLADRNVIGGTNGRAGKFEHSNIRAKLEIDVADALTATLGYSHSYVNDPRANFFSTYDHIPTTGYPSPPLRPTRFGVVAYALDSVKQGGKADHASLKLEWDTSIGTLTSITGYSDRDLFVNVDFGGTFLPIFDLLIRYDQKTWQQSIDYTIDAIDDLVVNIGGIYYDDALTQMGDKGTANVVAGNVAVIDQGNSYSKAWAIYIDGTYNLTDKLSLNLGGRYSYDKKRFNFTRTTPSGFVVIPFVEDSESWKEFTPRATVRYEIAPRTNVYASVTRGFRAGVYNQQGPVNNQLAPAEPETITAYEVGFKAAWPKVRFQAAVFYYDYKNLQVNVTKTDEFGGVTSVLLNSEGAKVKGFDAEVTVFPVKGLTLRGGISILDAYYTRFPNAVGTGVNADNTRNVSNQQQDLSGKELVRAPNYSGVIGFDYEIPTESGTFLLTSTLTFTDSYVVSNPSVFGPLAPPELRDKQRLRQRPYEVLSARLRWTDPTERYSLTVFGDNLTNTSYRLSYNAGGFGDYSAKADPRTYGVQMGYTF